MRTLAITVLTILALVGCQGAQEADGLAFVNVNIVDVEQGQVLADHTVIVKGNRIVDVGPSAQVSPPTTAQVVDGLDRYLIPGLWDMHTHLFDPDTPGAIEVTFPLLIANGVTGVRDTGALLDLLLFWRDEIAAGRVIGPRIVGTGPVLDGPPVVYAPLSTVLRTPNDARRSVRTLAQRGVDFVKAYEMLRPDVFMALVDEARLQGLPVIAHVPLALNAGDVSDAGVRSFEHLRNIELACSRDAETLLAIRTRLLEDGTARIGMELRRDIHRLQRPLALASYDADRCSALLGRLARNRTYQTATLFLSTKEARRPDRVGRVRDTLRYVPDTDRADWEDWSTGIDGYSAEEASARQAHSEWLFSLVRQMRDAGVPLLAGTDVSNPWMVPGFSLHEELAILVQAGLTPAEALRTATWNPANYFDALDRQGAVRTGQLADLVLLDGNPLSDIKNTTQIRAVVMDGRYYDRGELDRMLDEAEMAAASGDSDRPLRPNNRTNATSADER